MPYGITQSCHPAEAVSPTLTPAGTQFIHQLRLSRPEPTQVNDLPGVATEVTMATVYQVSLTWPSAPLGMAGVNNLPTVVTQ